MQWVWQPIWSSQPYGVYKRIIAYIDDKDIDIKGLMKHIKAPDFPTGAFIYGYKGVEEALKLVG